MLMATLLFGVFCWCRLRKSHAHARFALHEEDEMASPQQELAQVCKKERTGVAAPVGDRKVVRMRLSADAHNTGGNDNGTLLAVVVSSHDPPQA